MTVITTFKYHDGKDSDGIYRSHLIMEIEPGGELKAIEELVEMESKQLLLEEMTEMLNSGGEIIIIRPWFLSDIHKANILNACLRMGYTEIIPIGTSEHASYYMRKHPKSEEVES